MGRGMQVGMQPLPKFRQLFLGVQQEKFILNAFFLSINTYYASLDKVPAVEAWGQVEWKRAGITLCFGRYLSRGDN